MTHDLRLAFRLLAANRGFAAAAIATLGLGIGANTAVFSVVYSVLLRPAPVADLDRLVMVWETDRNTGTMREPASVPDYMDFRAQARRLDAFTGFAPFELNLAVPGHDPSRVTALRVSADIFTVTGARPIAGRVLTADDDRAGAAGVVLIGEGLWRRSFDGDASIVGRTVLLDGQPRTIAGVLSSGADFGILQILSAAAYGRGFADRGDVARVDVWAPLGPDAQALPRETHPLFVLGRLAPGATREAAQTELTAIAAELEKAYPSNRGRGVYLEPLREVVFARVRPTLYVLLAAVALVLLVACVNVASLFLARGAARGREIAVRRALGAGAGALARQFLIESAVLTAFAAATGVAVAAFGVRALVALAPAGIPRLEDASLDGPVLAVTVVLTSLVAAVFTMIPLAQAVRIAPQASLNDGGTRGTAGPGRGRLRGALVVGELALAVMLLAGAGLLIRSMSNLLGADPGFMADGVLKAEYQLPASRYPAPMPRWPDFPEQRAFTDAVIAAARSLPGVTAAAVAGNHPLDPGFTNSFRVVGREAEGASWPEISVRRVTAGYFDTTALRRMSGRLLSDADTATSVRVVVVNDAAAWRFFEGRDPAGAQIRLYGAAWTVVGVVENERFQGIAEAAPLAIYMPLAQAPSINGAGVLLVRTSGNPASLIAPVRTVFRDRDPELAVFGLEPLDETVRRSVGERSFAMLLLSVFAGAAMLLGAVGVYGVLSYEVTARRREIGIRLALGAKPAAILRRIIGEGLALTAVGVTVGGLAALGLGEFISSLLFGVSPGDPTTLAAVAGLLGAVTIVATAVPAWRAARIDPSDALRSQ